MNETAQLLDDVYREMEGSKSAADYSERHGIQSAAILTVHDDNTAMLVALSLAPRIKGKTVIEIGGGIGLLAMHMGHIAKRVYCIEANPMWSWVFAGTLLKSKPSNVSFLFGAADEFMGLIKGDIAIFCTHSGVQSMSLVAAQFSRVVVDVYGEMIAAHPENFDETARVLRGIA